MTTTTKDMLSEYLRDIGSKGGEAGTGDAKKRGSKAYYKELGRLGGEAKAKKVAAEAKAEAKPRRKRKARA